jgi:DNA polymerase-4
LAGGVSIAVKDNTLFYKEYQCKMNIPTHSTMEIAKEAFKLFQKNYNWQNHIRAVTVRVIQLMSKHIPRQISLFSDETTRDKTEKIESAMEKIRERFGKHAVTYACLLGDLKMPKTKDVELIMPQAMYA